jgi:hypothetical protein
VRSSFDCTFVENIEPLRVRRGLDAIEQGPRDFRVNAVSQSSVEDLVDGGESSTLGVEGLKDDVALEASAMLVVEVALG